jgi:hypothetical protein
LDLPLSVVEPDLQALTEMVVQVAAVVILLAPIASQLAPELQVKEIMAALPMQAKDLPVAAEVLEVPDLFRSLEAAV